MDRLMDGIMDGMDGCMNRATDIRKMDRWKIIIR